MTTKAGARARAVETRNTLLLNACQHAESFRFEVPSAQSITIHVEPDGMGRWAVTRYGWVEVVALTAQGWEPYRDVPQDHRFVWTVEAALLAIPDLLAVLEAEHAAWQEQYRQAERARQFAQVAEELLEPVRDVVNLLKAGVA